MTRLTFSAMKGKTNPYLYLVRTLLLLGAVVGAVAVVVVLVSV